jgi:nucleotide-binding universal stress UspA family protein
VFTRLLIGYDGSPGSQAALRAGLRLARTTGATVTVLTVRHHLPRYGATVGEVDEERELEDAQARRLAKEIEAEAAGHAVAVTARTAPGHPAQVIVRTARETDADLIVLGQRGHSAAWGGLLGGIADRVSHHAPCSVLIVRP